MKYTALGVGILLLILVMIFVIIIVNSPDDPLPSGSVVSLKSGGPPMTVRGGCSTWLRVDYVDALQQLHTECLPASSLRRVTL